MASNEAQAFDQLRDLLDAGPVLSRNEQRRLLVQAGLRAGWDDPEMDIYNDLVDWLDGALPRS